MQKPEISLWDVRFLGLASHISMWSKDPSTKCGAVIVRPDRTIASMGFNGYPQAVKDLFLEQRDYKYERVIHAEMNALVFARERLDGCTLYTWPFGPCNRCAVHVIQTGIKRVVSPDNREPRWTEAIAISRELFAEAEVEFTEHDRIWINAL